MRPPQPSMFRLFVVVLAVLAFAGCSTVPNRLGKHTEDSWYVVGQNNHIEIQASKHTPITETITLHGRTFAVDRDVWFVRIMNNDDIDWCVHPQLVSMDYDRNEPESYFFVPAHSSVHANTYIQRVWRYTNNIFVLNDAAIHVSNIHIWKPKHQQCNIENQH